MEVCRKELSFISSNGKDNIHVVAYVPSCDYYGYVQIIHDKYEHIGCYERVMKYYAENGYVCFGHDHLGHGQSLCSNKQVGSIDAEGFQVLLNDTNRAFLKVFNSFSPKHKQTYKIKTRSGNSIFAKTLVQEVVKPPLHALLGVGIGSIIAKLYAVTYEDVNCVVLCGDKPFKQLATNEIKLCNKAIQENGPDQLADDIVKVIERNYYRGFDSKKLRSYISSDKTVMNLYYEDPRCNFEYDLKSLKILLELENSLTINKWCDAYPLYLTTYIITGKDDPINNQTKEVTKMVAYMKNVGLKNILSKVYEGAHNLLFEKQRNIVMSDILHIFKAVEQQQYANKV